MTAKAAAKARYAATRRARREAAKAIREPETAPAGVDAHGGNGSTSAAELHARIPHACFGSNEMSDRQRNADGSGSTPVVTVRRSRSGRGLIVDACPHCGRRHVHGDGGERGRGWHGHRLAHCRTPHDASTGYLLIECSEPQTVALPPTG